MVCLLKMSRDLQMLFADVAHLDEWLSLQSLLTRWKFPNLLTGCKQTSGINTDNNNKKKYD
jgi:hypothetical protein